MDECFFSDLSLHTHQLHFYRICIKLRIIMDIPQLKNEQPGFLRFGGARMALFDIEAGFWSIRRQMEALIGSELSNMVLQQAGANGGASFAKSLGWSNKDTEQKLFFETCLQAYQIAGFGQFEIIKMDWPIGNVTIRAKDTFEAWMMQQNNQRVDVPICAYTAGVLVGFVNVVSNRRDVVCIEHHCTALGDAFCDFELLPASETIEKSVVSFIPNPSIGRQINLLEMLFERMPMGIAVLDREYRLQRYNPTWVDYSVRYAPPTATTLAPGVSYFDHLPGTESSIKPLFDSVLNGETVGQNSVQLESGGIVTYWDIVLTPLVENNEVAGILVVSVDATERVDAQQNLEQRVSERTRELQTLLDVTSSANSSLDLDETLRTTLDLLVDLIDASRAGVLLRNETSGKLEVRMLRPKQIVSPDELTQLIQACEIVVANDEPLYIEFDAALGFVEPGALLPLHVRDRKLGVLVLVGSIGGQFVPEKLALFKSIADQLSLAVEKSRLYRQAEQAAIATERNRLARDLHDAVTQTLFSASLIAEVLPKLWDRNPEAGKQKLDELRQLTRGALSEMRTLLLELRPASLADMDLGDLLRHLVNAFIGRTRVPAELVVNGQIDLPSDVKEVFYRVAQEALNNITKHASPIQVSVHLQRTVEKVQLEILDDGIGFDPQKITSESLGLSIMCERADSIGANLKIHSEPGAGTRIELNWKDEQK